MPPEIEDRRESLMASFDAIEAEEARAPQDEIVTEPPAEDTESGSRARDDMGRFAPKAEDIAASAPEAAPAPVDVPAPEPAAPSLTTWKKDFLPLQAKLESGQALTPEEAKKLAGYNVERERQYSTGVSTYKAEAQQAAHLQEAMAEFMPDLQQHNINPAEWIQNLGRAHSTLYKGTPEQKLQMFAKLAQDYGIPLPAVAQAAHGQMDPTATALMAEIQRMKQDFSRVTNWQQQQEQVSIQQELAKFQDTSKYPHFEQVRGEMARLLESGFAQDPETAYIKAVRLNDEAWSAEQGRQAAAQAAKQQASKQAAVAKAKASAGQVRTATPSGAPVTAKATDRRAAIAEAFESADIGRV